MASIASRSRRRGDWLLQRSVLVLLACAMVSRLAEKLRHEEARQDDVVTLEELLDVVLVIPLPFFVVRLDIGLPLALRPLVDTLAGNQAGSISWGPLGRDIRSAAGVRACSCGGEGRADSGGGCVNWSRSYLLVWLSRSNSCCPCHVRASL